MLMYLYRPPRADCPDYNETILHLQVLSILSTIFLKDTTQCHSSQKKLLTDVTLVHQHRPFDSNYLALQNCDWCARITIPIKGLLQALTFLLPTSIDQPFYVVTIPSFPLLFLAARKPQIDLLVQPSPNQLSDFQVLWSMGILFLSLTPLCPDSLRVLLDITLTVASRYFWFILRFRMIYEKRSL